MSNTTSDILMSAAGLDPGQRMRILCPTCGGGSKQELTLSVSVDDTGAVLWHCFRASCGASGRHGGGRLVRERHTPRQQTARPFRGELQQLTEEQECFLLKKIGWTSQHVAMARPRWSPDQQRYAFPVFGPMATRRGYVLRSYADDTNGAPKALTRMDVEEPHLSWYRFKPERPTVIVEDIPSAVRAAMYVNAVSLCGTGCGPDYANEIAAHTQDVVWALDADATRLAVKLHRDYALLFHNSRVLPLECDLKDMLEGDLSALMEEL